MLEQKMLDGWTDGKLDLPNSYEGGLQQHDTCLFFQDLALTLFQTYVAMARIPFLLTFWEASDMPSSILPPYAGEEKKHLDGEGLEPR